MGGCCEKSSTDDERRPFAAAQSIKTDEPKSARIPGTIIRPPPTEDAETIRVIKVRTTRIEQLDKSFKDLSQLYNDLVKRLDSLYTLSQDMTSHFSETRQTAGKPATKQMMIDTLTAIKSEAGDCIQVKRPHKFCVELSIEEAQVSSEASRAVRLYNSLNQGIRSDIEKLPSLLTSLRALRDEEKQFQRDIMVASLGPEGPESAANCRHNFQEVERAIEMAELIRQRLAQMFACCSEAARRLFD